MSVSRKVMFEFITPMEAFQQGPPQNLLLLKKKGRQYRVEKGWGYEIWIENTEKYCGKLLFFNKRKKCSWHYHKLKEETFYVQSGRFLLHYGWDDNFAKAVVLILNPGDSFHVPIGLRHRMTGLLKNNVLFEFSTTHFDSDSIRIIPGD